MKHQSDQHTTISGGDHILVLGAGNFGTCLAQHLAEKGYRVTIWCRSQEIADAIRLYHKNPKYLSTINLSPRLTATSMIDANLVATVNVVVHATPMQTMRSVLQLVAPHWRPEMRLVCAAKGIEIGSLALPGQVVADELGSEAAKHATILSGPTFASEMIAHQPTALTAASRDAASVKKIQELFHAAHFRVYSSDDPIGLEVAGALKNVVALAAGAAIGLGFQMNTRAAIITRGLAELTRFGVALGANPLTFNGLGGVGDLFLTCTSEKSRNFTVGYRIGRGEPLAGVLAAVGVAEGITTAKAAYALALQLGVDAPITTAVYEVLYAGKAIDVAVHQLMSRTSKAEHSWHSSI